MKLRFIARVVLRRLLLGRHWNTLAVQGRLPAAREEDWLTPGDSQVVKAAERILVDFRLQAIMDEVDAATLRRLQSR